MVERGGGVAGNHGGRKGMVGREGGGQGMVGIEGGEGVQAYLVEDKTTTMITSSSLSSLVSLLRLVAPSPNATRSHAPVGSFVVLGVWACLSFPLVAAGCRSGLVLAGRSLSSVWHSFVGRWPSFSSRTVVEVLGGCRRLGGRGC